MLAMPKSLFTILILLTAFQAFAFSEKKQSDLPPPSGAQVVNSSTPDTVWVRRQSQGKQCSDESKTSLELAARDLSAAGVHVIESKKQGDGKMHPALCGLPTGNSDVIRIPKSDLPKAMAKGFEEVPASP